MLLNIDPKGFLMYMLDPYSDDRHLGYIYCDNIDVFWSKYQVKVGVVITHACKLVCMIEDLVLEPHDSQSGI